METPAVDSATSQCTFKQNCLSISWFSITFSGQSANIFNRIGELTKSGQDLKDCFFVKACQTAYLTGKIMSSCHIFSMFDELKRLGKRLGVNSHYKC